MTSIIPVDYNPEGVPFAMVVAGDGSALWLTEANGEQILRVTPQGEISRVVDLSPLHPVPVGIASAPDGGVIVSNLSPAPHADGTAKIIHVAPDGTIADVWTHLTAAVAVSVGPDGSFYALELSTNNTISPPFFTPGSGRVLRRTSAGEVSVIANGLDLPVALDVGPEGEIYVALPAFGPGGTAGAIARLDAGGTQTAATPVSAECPAG